MRPIVTDGVVSSVGWSVTLVGRTKMAEPIEMPFGLSTRVAQGTIYYMGVEIPRGKGQFSGAGRGVPL